MIDLARPYDQTMCELYQPANSAPTRLEDFQVFGKNPFYMNYEAYPEPDAQAIYQELLHPAVSEFQREEWRGKAVADWDEDDTVAWVADAAPGAGFGDFHLPLYNFRVPGTQLRDMRREQLQACMAHPNVDPALTRSVAQSLYEKLQARLHEEMIGQGSAFRFGDPYRPEPARSVLDLDSLENRHRVHQFKETRCDSDEEFSPCLSSNSDADGSKSGDDDDRRKSTKRLPGRPKGSGRKGPLKRPRSVSVPEFLRNLLLDPLFCPAFIKWEDYSQGKFRFVKPDEVAKLWGKLKQNDHMTFEKFSRAMRYHYKQKVLQAVTAARLVYQFGPKGPSYETDNPNFCSIKPEIHLQELTYS